MIICIKVVIFWIYWVATLLTSIHLFLFTLFNVATRKFRLHTWLPLHFYWTVLF